MYVNQNREKLAS